MARGFRGHIGLDVRDSTPDWSAFLPAPAPPGSPNVLVVLYDDIGMAAWSRFGGRINMPTLDRLARDGLTYTQWHTTGLGAPTRSCLLTGRQHHRNGVAASPATAAGFPGHHSHIPPENATMATVLRDAGWSTFWVGKNDTVPVADRAMGAPRGNWPLARGYDRFYGYIGDRTSQWHPNLAEDNHYVTQPYHPEDGYHLSKDLADKALEFIRDVHQTAPDRPWYLWLCPGAGHAPHHAPPDYADRYRGAFEDGYETYREWALPRMIERGVVPPGTTLTPINPMREGTFDPRDTVRPWSDLSAEERRLYARMAEVYAGFCEYADAQVGRVIDYLAEAGRLDNTLVVYAAASGASGGGGPGGSVNQSRSWAGHPDSVEDDLEMIDRLGGPETDNHYPTGWAAAFSTPYRMFKRFSSEGGVAAPLVVSWPAGIASRGEVRHQYHHAVDIVPTILDCCGLAMPGTVGGVAQAPLTGVSMRYSFDHADAPTARHTQYYEMLGTRALWHRGWKVVAEHGPAPSSLGQFDRDRWQLFHTDVDRAEAYDLAADYPEKVGELVDRWHAEAHANNVLPLNDLTEPEFRSGGYGLADPVPPPGRHTYYPGTGPIAERSAAGTHGMSFTVLAYVELTPDSQGVIFAHGSRFGGHALYLKDHRLVYVHNFLGLPPEQILAGDAPLSGRHVIGVEFDAQWSGESYESRGPARLHVDDVTLAEAEIRTMTGHLPLGGEGLCVGYDTGDAVTPAYRPPFRFTDGRIDRVVFDAGDDPGADATRPLEAAMSRDD